MAAQVIEQPPGVARAVDAAIADEDAGHDQGLRLSATHYAAAAAMRRATLGKATPWHCHGPSAIVCIVAAGCAVRTLPFTGGASRQKSHCPRVGTDLYKYLILFSFL
jgi:hypothetical protein